jgi:integrase
MPRKQRRAAGEGSISQRANGRWQASIQLDGRRRTVYGLTRQEASAKLEALKRQASDAGAVAMPGKRTMNDLLDAWLAVKAPTLKARTYADYAAIADVYIRPALGAVALARLTPDRIARLYAKWQAAGKGRTARKIHQVLRPALAMAVRWAWLAVNPCERVDAPKWQAAPKAVWSRAELAAFLAGTEGHWLRPLWLAALGSGLRLGELLALTWDDIDLAAGALSVTKSAQVIAGERVTSTPKTRAGVRRVTLPGDVVAALRAHRATQAAQRLAAPWHGDGPAWLGGELVFTNPSGGPLRASVVEQAQRRLCAKLDIPRLTPHGLRHCHASLLLAGGLAITDVSKRLGHGSAAITLKVYAHAIEGSDGGAADVIGRAMGESLAMGRR